MQSLTVATTWRVDMLSFQKINQETLCFCAASDMHSSSITPLGTILRRLQVPVEITLVWSKVQSQSSVPSSQFQWCNREKFYTGVTLLKT